MANLTGVEYKESFQDHIKTLAPAGRYDSGICVLAPTFVGAVTTGDDVRIAKLPARSIVIRASVIGSNATLTLKAEHATTADAPGANIALGNRVDEATDLWVRPSAALSGTSRFLIEYIQF